jgi:hypothetical protein
MRIWNWYGAGWLMASNSLFTINSENALTVSIVVPLWEGQ